MSIGENIKMYRKQKGLTQKELAELSNYSESAIRKIEGSLRAPNSRTLSSIANALECSAEDLLNTRKSTSLGARIAECRKQKGLSQRGLAEKSNITRESIGNYERGNNLKEDIFVRASGIPFPTDLVISQFRNEMPALFKAEISNTLTLHRELCKMGYAEDIAAILTNTILTNSISREIK